MTLLSIFAMKLNVEKAKLRRFRINSENTVAGVENFMLENFLNKAKSFHTRNFPLREH